FRFTVPVIMDVQPMTALPGFGGPRKSLSRIPPAMGTNMGAIGGTGANAGIGAGGGGINPAAGSGAMNAAAGGGGGGGGGTATTTGGGGSGGGGIAFSLEDSSSVAISDSTIVRLSDSASVLRSS